VALTIIAVVSVLDALLGFISYSIQPASGMPAIALYGILVALVAVPGAALALRDRSGLWRSLGLVVALAGVGGGAAIILQSVMGHGGTLLGPRGLIALACVVVGSFTAYIVRGLERRRLFGARHNPPSRTA
jgi:hypothetical protein